MKQKNNKKRHWLISSLIMLTPFLATPMSAGSAEYHMDWDKGIATITFPQEDNLPTADDSWRHWVIPGKDLAIFRLLEQLEKIEGYNKWQETEMLLNRFDQKNRDTWGWRDEKGRSLLHFFVVSENRIAIHWLVKEKLRSIFIVDQHNETPIHLACKLRSSNSLQALLEASDEVYLPVFFGLRSHCPPGNTPLDDLVDGLQPQQVAAAQEIISYWRDYIGRMTAKASDQLEILLPGYIRREYNDIVPKDIEAMIASYTISLLPETLIHDYTPKILSVLGRDASV